MIRKFFYLGLFLSLMTSCGPGKEDKNVNSGQDTTKAAIASLTKEISDNNKDPELYNRRAKYYLADKQPDLALKDANQAIAFSSKPAYYITLSDAYLLKGQPQNSSSVLSKALEIDPKNMDVLLALANLNLIIREYKTAIDYVKRSLDIEPVNNPRAFFIRGLVFLENGDTVSAVDDLKKSASLDQNNFEAFLQLGELYSMRKDRIAADYLRNALRVRPKSKEALYLLGMFYQNTEQYDQAIATYDTLKKIDTSYKNAAYNEGYIYLVYLKQMDKAVKCFSDAISEDPMYAEAWYNRGYAYELMGDYENASKNYKRTLELKVNYQKAIDALNRLDKIRQ